MKLEHKLKSRTNEIPLRFDPRDIETIHEEDAQGNLSHVGWGITAHYDGDNPRQMGHEYTIIFTPEEADELFRAWDELRQRFEPDWTPPANW